MTIVTYYKFYSSNLFHYWDEWFNDFIVIDGDLQLKPKNIVSKKICFYKYEPKDLL